MQNSVAPISSSQDSTNPRVIILAAGRGTRLAPLTDDRPKCLVPISGEITILEHQLRKCLQAGLREVIVITGYKWDVVEECIAKWTAAHLSELRVKTVYNPFYGTSNNLVSLWAARHFMDRDFVLVNGDDVFDSRIIGKAAAATEFDIQVCIDRKGEYDSDDMKVVLGSGRLAEINKTIESARADGESIGIMKFSKGGAARLSAELETMVRGETGMSDWYTLAIERIAKSGFEVGVVDIEGMPWAEVDFPQDLEYVRNELTHLAE